MSVADVYAVARGLVETCLKCWVALLWPERWKFILMGMGLEVWLAPPGISGLHIDLHLLAIQSSVYGAHLAFSGFQGAVHVADVILAVGLGG